MRFKTWTVQMLMLAMLATMATRAHAQSQAQAGDELIIQRVKDTTQAAIVHAPQKIIAWTADGERRRGRVTQIDTDSVALDSIKISLASVIKVRAYSKEIGTQRMNAWAKRCAWVALGGLVPAMVGVIAVFAIGLAPLAILVIVLGGLIFAISFFILLGTILAQIGANIPATTFKLKRGWQLKVHKMKKPAKPK